MSQPSIDETTQPAPEIQEKEKELDALQAKLAAMEANWKRALADYQNLERRIREQRRSISQLACLQLVERMLPVLDHLELAASHINDPGLKLVASQFQEALTSEGVVTIEAEGAEFDPTLMECIELVPGEKNRVTAVITKGYRIEDRVIRPARVHVGSGEKKIAIF